MRPYCFVLMPFGKKTDEAGRTINFDDLYDNVIKPAIEAAELDPIRADEEMVGGLIHKPMFERLMMCDYAVADLTTANANVFYELGVRHGVRPHSTVLLAAHGTRLPFDVAPLRALMYDITRAGRAKSPSSVAESLTTRLLQCREPADDSPVYQLISNMPRHDIERLKTDTFRDLVEYSRETKQRLADARRKGVEEIVAIEVKLNIIDTDPAILIDLLLSYRAVEAWAEMIALVEKLSAPLKGVILVQEQLAFALNRSGHRERAEEILVELISKHGPSSETNGLLGSVYKDRWQEELGRSSLAAAGFLRKAIEAYVDGFETDWRDAYPGVNAVTLMEMTAPPDERQAALLPVVRYATIRRVEDTTPDYWDHATLLELAVLAADKQAAEEHLGDALSSVREPWEPKTTARNLRLIAEARAARGEDTGWITTLSEHLNPAGR